MIPIVFELSALKSHPAHNCSLFGLARDAIRGE
jgi:hypothetical protein